MSLELQYHLERVSQAQRALPHDRATYAIRFLMMIGRK